MNWQFVIPGAPRTKKTSNRIVRCGKFPKVLPSLAFIEWNKVAQMALACHRAQTNLDHPDWKTYPLEYPVNCCALFYRDALRGDACNYYEALADALEEAGIVENDKLIISWDGSRLLKDAANPRIDVTLEAV